MNTFDIKFVETKEKLKELYYFISKVFYDDAIEYNEHYYPMYDAYTKMCQQFERNKRLLLYIEEDKQIVAAVTSKDMTETTITISTLAVDKKYRGKGYAKNLIIELEKQLKKIGIKSISLGARFRACDVYLKLGYKPQLLVQVNDFVTIDEVKKTNIYNYKIINEYQNDVSGGVFFEINKIEKEIIDYFEKNIPTAHAQYIFTKNL